MGHQKQQKKKTTQQKKQKKTTKKTKQKKQNKKQQQNNNNNKKTPKNKARQVQRRFCMKYFFSGEGVAIQMPVKSAKALLENTTQIWY